MGVKVWQVKNVAHRDLKPANIMILINGKVGVIDAGYAMRLNRKRCQQIAGTPLYRPPEIWYDCRFDNYSAGVIMYEMLVGDIYFLCDTENIVYPNREDYANRYSEYQKESRDARVALNAAMLKGIENATKMADGRGYIISREAAELMTRLLAPIQKPKEWHTEGYRCDAQTALNSAWCMNDTKILPTPEIIAAAAASPCEVNSMDMTAGTPHSGRRDIISEMGSLPSIKTAATCVSKRSISTWTHAFHDDTGTPNSKAASPRPRSPASREHIPRIKVKGLGAAATPQPSPGPGKMTPITPMHRTNSAYGSLPRECTECPTASDPSESHSGQVSSKSSNQSASGSTSRR